MVLEADDFDEVEQMLRVVSKDLPAPEPPRAKVLPPTWLNLRMRFGRVRDRVENLSAGIPNNGQHKHLELRRRLKELPEKTSKVLRSVRSDAIREDLLDLVDERVAGSAKRELAFEHDLETFAYIPAVDRRRVLRDLDDALFQELRAKARAKKARAHVERVYQGWPKSCVPKDLPHITIPASGTWEVPSWLGLGTAPHLESKPEGWAVAVAKRFWEPEDGDLDFEEDLRTKLVLDHGAGPSTMALALWAAAPPEKRDAEDLVPSEGPPQETGERDHEGRVLLADPPPTTVQAPVEIHEVDTVGQAASIPWVECRSSVVPTQKDLEGGLFGKRRPKKPCSYDLVVLHIPPPSGPRANNLRNRYKDLGEGKKVQIQRGLMDIGRLGPKRWLEELPKVVREVLPLTAPDGVVALLLPLAVRVKEGRGFGYRPQPEVLEGVTEILTDHGLVIESDTVLKEANPLPQPFVGKTRCPWRSIIAKRANHA